MSHVQAEEQEKDMTCHVASTNMSLCQYTVYTYTCNEKNYRYIEKNEGVRMNHKNIAWYNVANGEMHVLEYGRRYEDAGERPCGASAMNVIGVGDARRTPEKGRW